MERNSSNPAMKQYVQLRLSEPALLLPGDRFIVRQFSPVVTIGGGFVLDASPLARKQPQNDDFAFLFKMMAGSPEEVLAARVRRRGTLGLSLDDVPGEMNIRREEAAKLAAKAGLVWCNQVLVAPAAYAGSEEQMHFRLSGNFTMRILLWQE